MGAMILDLMAFGPERRFQRLLQRQARMVGGERKLQ